MAEPDRGRRLRRVLIVIGLAAGGTALGRLSGLEYGPGTGGLIGLVLGLTVATRWFVRIVLETIIFRAVSGLLRFIGRLVSEFWT